MSRDDDMAWEVVELNPYPDEAEPDWMFVDQPRFETPNTPSSTSEDAASPPTYGRRPSDVESDDEFNQLTPRRKRGGYDSRIEQILYENPELPIFITDAGKSMESGGKFIVYAIRTGVRLLACRVLVRHLHKCKFRTSKCGVATRNLRHYVML